MSERFATNRAMLVPVLLTKARLAAVGGDLSLARAALAEATAHTSDLHLQTDVIDVLITAITALVDSLAGDHKLAAVGYRRARDHLLEMNRAPDAASYAAYAARELFEQGELADAELALHQLTSGADELDPRTVVLTTSLEARLAACAERLTEAVELASNSAVMSERADDLCLQGSTYLDLAIVARQAGQADVANRATTTAIGRYEAKGAIGLIRRAHNLLGNGESGA
jgi:tetratricopeptide (TPR) repeat protein